MTRLFFRFCVALILAALLAAPRIQAGESGCIEGALPQGIHQYGPAPGGAYELLGCVRIVNDRPYAREEVAYASVPIAADVNLTDTTGLALIGAGSVWVAGQFDVISRWGATVDDTAAGVRWLQVSTPVSAGADATTAYELRRYSGLVIPNDANAVQRIYTPYVASTAVSFEMDVPSVDEIRRIVNLVETPRGAGETRRALMFCFFFLGVRALLKRRVTAQVSPSTPL